LENLTDTNSGKRRIMLRMMLLGLLIPLGVGVLSAMELRTPPRQAAAVVQTVAETTPDVSDSRDALPKADRLEVAAASSEAPIQLAATEQPLSPPEDAAIARSEPAALIQRDRHAPKLKKFTVATRAKSKPTTFAIKTTAVKKAATKPAAIKRIAVAQRSRAAGGTEPCRLRAFGGLLRALNSTDCDI
jgi:hypothetical protein